MFEKFDDTARTAINRAGQFARYYRHDYIGTGHLLFGIVAAVGHDLALVAGDAILRLGADPQSIRDLVLAGITDGTEPSPGHLPFTSNVKAALERTVSTAEDLGSNHVGAEHLLAGLAGDPGSTAGQILAPMGITEAAVRDAITADPGPSPTSARSCVVYLPAGKSVFKNGGKIYPDLASAQAAHPGKEIAPFAVPLNEGEFFDVGTTSPRFSSWGKFASYPDAYAAAEEFSNVQGADVKIRIMVPDVMELRGKDSRGHDVVLGRSVEYSRVSVINRLAAVAAQQ